MGGTAGRRHGVASAGIAATALLLAACSGGDGGDSATAASPMAALALEGRHLGGRDETLQVVAGAVAAPLACSELAHAMLANAFEQRAHERQAPASAGDRWVAVIAAGPVAVEIESADHAEGLMLRGEAGQLRALLRLDRLALGASARIDGTVLLDVERGAAGAGAARRTRSDVLAVSAAERSLRWSYLDLQVGADQALRSLDVVSAVPLAGGEVWLDVTSRAPGHYSATGVTGFLKPRLALEVGADGGWTIGVDDDRDGSVDFVVQASPDEARRAAAGAADDRLVSACAAE